MNNKKLLYILPHLGKGGAESLIINLANYVSKSNYVELLLFYKINEDLYNINKLSKNVKVSYVINFNINFFSLYRYFIVVFFYLTPFFVAPFIYKKFKIYDFNIIHGNLTLSSFYIPFFVMIRRLINSNEKYFFTFHNNLHLLKGISKFLNLYLWRYADKFFYEIRRSDIVELSKYVAKHKIIYIPFGFSSSNFDYKDIKSKFEFLKDIPSNNKIFLVVSRIEFFNKKIDTMIEIMKLYKFYHNSKFTFLIAGDGSDISNAKSLVKTYDIESNVIFLGFQDHPEALADIADVCLAASVDDQVGIFGMQAISRGRPLLGIQTIIGRLPKFDDACYSHFNADECAKFLVKLQTPEFYRSYQEKMFLIKLENERKSIEFFSNYCKYYELEINQ